MLPRRPAPTTTPRAGADAPSAERSRSTKRSRIGWAWLAGGDGYVLQTVPSEASFLGALGMWVGGMAVVSGFAMTVAASQWWSTSILSVIWVLPVWAVLYCLIERLVLKSFSTKWTWNIALTIPRLVLSLAIALVVGLPMSQVIYSGSINDQLSRTTTVRVHEATNDITALYGAKIAAAQKEIAAAEAREATLEKQVTQSKFLAGCEIGVQDCSETHKLGCGPYCKRDLRRAAAAAAALTRARPGLEATITAAQSRIATWRATEAAQIAARTAAIKADRDFLSRQAALEQVMKDNPAVTKYVQFFLLFLIAIDLVAIILKLTHLLSTGAAYERSAAALRSLDIVESHRLQSHADLLMRRITLEAQAESNADELRILGDTAPGPLERPVRDGRRTRQASAKPATE
jgi:hypothetical protein